MSYVKADPTACPAAALLIYSWDECDEGGGALVPTWTATGPNAATLNAVGAVLTAN